MRRAALLRAAAARLAEAGVEGPERDARLLLRHAAGLSGAALSAALEETADPEEAARFEALVTGRAARRPLSHLVGAREFWGRPFRVTPEVLDPRPETETLVAAALAAPFARVLDLGAGSGCILLTLLAERPGATGVGVDASAAALAVAAWNAAALGVADRAELRAGDWCAGLSGRFDLVVSNPPYVAAAEMPGLAPEVRLHEPAGALTDGGDGLAAFRAIAAGLPALLAPRARVIVEHGPGQAPQVEAILSAAGLRPVTRHADLDGRDRAAELRAP